MMSYLRKNAYNNGGTFENTDLLWYAKAVGVMKSKPISDVTSWWFYAAIHGEYLVATVETPKKNIPTGYPNWAKIEGVPIPKTADGQVDKSKLPSEKQITQFWDQCQHGTWFFFPWHRGFIAAIENILRDIIVKELRGPADWALPYWNYLNQSKVCDESRIPPAFTQLTLPDGTPNPLYVIQRYGPDDVHHHGEIFVEVGDDDTNDACQFNKIFTNTQLDPNDEDVVEEYGGAKTGFSRHGHIFSVLEDNPHNNVHSNVGGARNNSEDRGEEGLMSDTGVAALDPIFYIHHVNIDRMWTAWNETGKNENPTDPEWLAGPSSIGQRDFVMPMDAVGTPWVYTPEDMNSTTIRYYNNPNYAYTYDDLSLTSYSKEPLPTLLASIDQRLIKLKVKSEKEITMETNKKSELIGASGGLLTLNSGMTEATVQLDNTSWKSVADSLLDASPISLPDEVYLLLEGVTGVNNSNFLFVSVNGKFVKKVSLFGIRNASMADSTHGGSGLTFRFNITNIVDDMHLAGNIDVSSLNVQIKTRNPILGGSELKIRSMRVYRLSQ